MPHSQRNPCLEQHHDRRLSTRTEKSYLRVLGCARPVATHVVRPNGGERRWDHDPPRRRAVVVCVGVSLVYHKHLLLSQISIRSPRGHCRGHVPRPSACSPSGLNLSDACGHHPCSWSPRGSDDASIGCISAWWSIRSACVAQGQTKSVHGLPAGTSANKRRRRGSLCTGRWVRVF